MSEDVTLVATVLTATGCLVVGGVFYAFSSFVMKALHQLPPSQGIAAMQSINVVVVNPWFMVPLFSTAIACLALGIVSLTSLAETASKLRLVGCLVYLVGTIGVTIAFNVPRNDALTRMDPESAQDAVRWADYVSGWTAWNSVRTAAAIAAGLAIVFALVIEAEG